MFAYNQSTTSAHQFGAVEVVANQQAATLVERLKEIARTHRTCYEVWPEWSTKDGRKIQIGFELQLCGVNEHAAQNGKHAVPGCPRCFRTYTELRQIAEWVLPHEERPSRYEIQGFDHALHQAPSKRQRRSEVVLTIVIMHRNDFNRPVDDCESRCLKEMRERLSELDIQEDVWRSEVTQEASNEVAG